MSVTTTGEYVVVTNYRSATASAGGTNTITGSFVAGEVGRAVWIHTGTGRGQINYIESVASGVATCRYDWADLEEGTGVVPDNTSQFYVSHIPDDLTSEASVTKYGNNLFNMVGKSFQLGTNHFFWMRDGETLFISHPSHNISGALGTRVLRKSGGMWLAFGSMATTVSGRAAKYATTPTMLAA
jgi:hypothetical protein